MKDKNLIRIIVAVMALLVLWVVAPFAIDSGAPPSLVSPYSPVAAAPKAPSAPNTVWEYGDVFVGVEHPLGTYLVYSNAGVFKGTIVNGVGGSTAGCAFDHSPNSNLYTTSFGQLHVVKYSGIYPHPILQAINTSSQGGISPESIVITNNGDFYVGHADGNRDIQKYNAAGVYQQSYDVATGLRGSDWMDLSTDQCTMFYTSEGGGVVRRYNVCTDTQLPDFANMGGLPTQCDSSRPAMGQVV